MDKVLAKGNEAIAEAAIRAGCELYFGYPITPQNELPEYMAAHLPEAGGVFLQAESELAAINMVYGAAGTGKRVMTSSSSPGISLKMEGISYIAAAELPCVIVNMVRGGPGLGGIQPSQSDYFQATKGGGHGDYRLVVLAPATVQEAFDLTGEAFDIADKYRIPVMLLGDGVLGQMMEPVVFKDFPRQEYDKSWATTGARGRAPNIINSFYARAEDLEKLNRHLQAKYRLIKENEVRCEEYEINDAELILVAYGTTSRIVKKIVRKARQAGEKLGLIRPISLYPFPEKVLARASENTGAFLTVEMNEGQMVEDVRLAVNGRVPVYFHGRSGGMIPDPDDIVAEIEKIIGRRLKGLELDSNKDQSLMSSVI